MLFEQTQLTVIVRLSVPLQGRRSGRFQFRALPQLLRSKTSSRRSRVAACSCLEFLDAKLRPILLLNVADLVGNKRS
jgi:hypothetical protein